MEKKLVVGLGEALWDCLPEGRKLGGAPANFAYHAQMQGMDGRVVSAVGKDELGDEIVEQLTAKGLNLAIERVAMPTGTVRVTLSGDGIPSYDICRGVAWDNIPWSNALRELAQKTDAVCFGSLAQRDEVSRHTIMQFLESTPETALRVFDINLRQEFYSAEVIDQSLRHANILKINDDEWEIVKPMMGLSPILENNDGARSVKRYTNEWFDGLDKLISRYDLHLLILTCGTSGSYVFDPSGLQSFLPTPKVEVVDTVGAGDSFTGSFVASILKGMEVKVAHQKAVQVSAYVCTQAGPMPTLPEGLA
ncbi:MAG: carbohydrate kinase [Bacteroidaceae bacterium]|nr:carbohydrate kinase [Bacteroidaceae bacterium]